MRTYNRNYTEDNAQLEFTFEAVQDVWPPQRAVRQLAKRVGISEPHARAAIVANGARHD